MPEAFARALKLLMENIVPVDRIVRSEVRLEDLPAHFQIHSSLPFEKVAVRP
jgi:hypothetical protein